MHSGHSADRRHRGGRHPAAAPTREGYGRGGLAETDFVRDDVGMASLGSAMAHQADRLARP